MDKLNKYLNNNTKITSHKLKILLIQEKLKKHQCESCLLSEWLEKKIPLELHHIDGNSSNNNLENLQVLCPNCHSLTDNYRAKKQYRKIIKKSLEEIIEAIESSYNARQALLKLGYAAKGGNYERIRNIKYLHKISFREPTIEEKNIEDKIKKKKLAKKKRISKSGRSKEEAWLASRKVIRPSKEELLKMVWNESILKIAKSMGVCDNTIRKWAEIYQIPVPPVGYWAKFNNKHFQECLEIKIKLFNKYGLEIE